MPLFTPYLPAYNTATIADSAAINTTETVVGGPMLVPGWNVGTTFIINLNGVCTTSVANVSTFTIRAGTAGTVADAAIATATITAAATGTAIPFRVTFYITVRALSTTSTIGGAGEFKNNSAATGISATAGSTLTTFTPTATLNTTTATQLSVSYKSAATTTTSTFKECTIEIVKP